eukprot:1314155-Alexandrium_andersonii.AAC.1
MSASLVGSEMCIRDSHAGGVGRAWLYGELPEVLPFPNPSPSGWYSPLGGCLLYTSDAADDM